MNATCQVFSVVLSGALTKAHFIFILCSPKIEMWEVWVLLSLPAKRKLVPSKEAKNCLTENLTVSNIQAISIAVKPIFICYAANSLSLSFLSSRVEVKTEHKICIDTIQQSLERLC